MAEPWLSADEIAAYLGVTKDTVYPWIAENAMPAHKVGCLWEFQASGIDAWVRAGAAATDHEAAQHPMPTSVVTHTFTTTKTGRADDDPE